GPESVSQIRSTAGWASAGLRPVAVLRVHRAGQLLDELRAASADLRIGARLECGGLGFVYVGRGPGESPVGVEAGAAAPGIECAGGVAGAAGGVVAGQRGGLGRPAELQPAQRDRSLLLQKPHHSIGVLTSAALACSAFKACSSA